MEERGLFGAAARAADVFIALPAADAAAAAFALAAELRAAGLRVDVFPHAAKLGAAVRGRRAQAHPLRHRRRRGEAAGDGLDVRDLTTRTNTAVARAGLATWFREKLPAA